MERQTICLRRDGRSAPRRRILPAALFAVSILLSQPALASSISIWAEIYEPLSYRQGDKITGMSTEIVERLVHHTGVAVNKWTLAPWARAFNVAKQTPNALLYTVVRKPDREALFH